MIGVKSNTKDTLSQLDALKREVEKATVASLGKIRDVTVDAVTDNTNWNPSAVYKDGPQKGEPYDLELSGQLMSTIRDIKLNEIESLGSGKYVLGIGNIAALDSLASDKRGKNPDGRYWRLVVYGRAAIPGWVFVTSGATWGAKSRKLKGVSIPSEDGEIAASEPTMMFDNGLSVAERSFSEIVDKTFQERLGKF